MMGPSHLLLGAVAGATYAAAVASPTSVVILSAIAATAVAHGPSSPDMDQTDTWRAIVPPRLRTHRFGASHWFGWPLLVWLFLIPNLDPEARTLAVPLLIGWTSHLIGDLPFGRLALFPWGGPKFGFRLKTDGWIERSRFGISPLRTALAAALGFVLWQQPTLADWQSHAVTAWTWLAGLL